METLTTTPTQAAAILADCIAADVPVFLHGSPGIGKSQITAQVAAAAGRDLFDVRLLTKDLPDLAGYLVLSSCEAGQPPQMTAPADMPPSDHPRASVLMLDELTSAPRDLAAAAFQLVLERRLNSYTLPTDCAIVAAGNLSTDRGVVNAMPSPLRNRFVHLHLVADRAQWVAWAMAAGVHPLICAYHSWEQSGLMVFDPKSDEAAFASPRSWEALSRLLAVNAAPCLQLICGTVGTGQGTSFAGFIRIAAELPTAEMVFFAPDAAPVPAEPSALFATVANLANAQVDISHFDSFVRYIDRLPGEYSALAMDLVRAKLGAGMIQHHQAFVTWARAHAYLF